MGRCSFSQDGRERHGGGLVRTFSRRRASICSTLNSERDVRRLSRVCMSFENPSSLPPSRSPAKPFVPEPPAAAALTRASRRAAADVEEAFTSSSPPAAETLTLGRLLSATPRRRLTLLALRFATRRGVSRPDVRCAGPVLTARAPTATAPCCSIVTTSWQSARRSVLLVSPPTTCAGVFVPAGSFPAKIRREGERSNRQQVRGPTPAKSV